MANKEWFTFRAMPPARLNPGTTPSWSEDIGIEGARVSDGDTILRWLVEWRAESVINDNSSGMENMFWPFAIGLSVVPEPFGMASYLAQADDGEAIYSQYAHWQPQSWTDGTLFGTKWYAGTPVPQDIQAERKILDKSTFSLRMSASFIHPDDMGGDDDLFQFADVMLYMRVRALILEKNP